MATDWKSAYATMHQQGHATFPPAGMHYLLQLTRLAVQMREGRPVSPAELVEDFRKQTSRDFGALVSQTLKDWQLCTPEDLGNAVVLLAQYGCLTLESTDTVEAFAGLGTEW